MTDKPRLQTAANYYITQFYRLAVQRGLDADALLRKAGLDSEVVGSPSTRVDAQKLADVLLAVWDELQDESLSLSASGIPRGAFFLMGKLTVHEQSLAKALALAARFYAMVTRAYRVELRVEADKASLLFHMQNPEMDAEHLFAEITLLAWHRFSSWLIAENIVLNEVYFPYPRPAQVGEYGYLFPGKHVFDHSTMGFSFHRRFLDCEVVQNTDSLIAFFKRGPVELFQQPKTDFSLSGELQLLLNRHIREGFPTIEKAAVLLHMTRRTLIRKLKEEGTSYQQIKDLVRRNRAIFYLTNYPLGVAEVAEKVGFSDPAVFARAFKAWTGLSPREYRVNSETGGETGPE